ncbi:hypothetical protein Ccrd_018271 [Cynara cardunculus var. scolymus]|uniref:non-specific serine/threonine protein kinase n=1 Tax=Cynara cardunculus var. scolymus TaxID=59895 RepID=A0A118K1V7_CYNCS|nr:hypothetical protein Ccrd_018271 [Cynara cardunculus var. scolymus]
MGLCHGKPNQTRENQHENSNFPNEVEPTLNSQSGKTSNFPYYSPSPFHNSTAFKNSPANSSVGSTPLRIFKRPFPPPSPAKHIRSLLARRHGSVKPNEASIPEGNEFEVGLDKNFGYSKQLLSHYELGEEVGRGHFGYTCTAKGKKGSMKGHDVAVKVIPKSKMTTVIAIEDARREVKILRALTGHDNLVQFYDAYEDEDNVYIVMELCKGGELLDRILARGGKYSEEDAKAVMVQILRVTAYCHLQGVVHRDLKPENFLFTSKDEHSLLKAIDFGLSDYVKPAPEVLHRSYGTEADMWSIGVIAYILLCGSRPFWARTESGIFRAVLKADPNFDEAPWPSLSSDAVDFVKRSSMAGQLSRRENTFGHDNLQDRKSIYMLISSKKSCFRGCCKDFINYRARLSSRPVCGTRSKQKRIHIHAELQIGAPLLSFLCPVSSLQHKKFDFEEFGAAAISIHQLEAMENWEQLARLHVVLQDWIRHADGKLSFLGFIRLLHGASSRAFQKA